MNEILEMGKCVVTTQTGHEYETLEDFLSDLMAGTVAPTVGIMVACVLRNGHAVDFVITDVDEDAIRFESRDCLGEYTPMTEMRAYLARVWDVLPLAFQKRIIPTERRHFDATGEIVTSNDTLFLPAASEIFPEDECFSDNGLYTQMEWYKNWRHHIRMFEKGGAPDWYWTSSRYPDLSSYFAFVTSDGHAGTTGASDTDVAATVCFRIPRNLN